MPLHSWIESNWWVDVQFGGRAGGEAKTFQNNKLKINFLDIFFFLLRRKPNSGYFVCSFMVLCNNLSPTEALKNFSDARGHRIERQNYIEGIESHGKNETLKDRLLQICDSSEKRKSEAGPKKVKPPGNNFTSRRQISTRATASHNNLPRRNEASNGYNWRSQRHDYSADRSLPDDNRFYFNPDDNSQVARGGPRSRRGGYAHSNNYDPYPLPRNSSTRSKSRESLRAARHLEQQGRSSNEQGRRGGQHQSYQEWRNSQRRDYGSREESQPQHGHPVNEGWNYWVAKRMGR